MSPSCWFEYLGGCEGRLVKAHLIPKQRIKREHSYAGRTGWAGIDEMVWDERCWTWMCGGITGIGGHHGAFDAKQIRIQPWDLPPSLLEYAQEYGLEWCLERDYGVKV